MNIELKTTIQLAKEDVLARPQIIERKLVAQGAEEELKIWRTLTRKQQGELLARYRADDYTKAGDFFKAKQEAAYEAAFEAIPDLKRRARRSGRNARARRAETRAMAAFEGQTSQEESEGVWANWVDGESRIRAAQRYGAEPKGSLDDYVAWQSLRLTELQETASDYHSKTARAKRERQRQLEESQRAWEEAPYIDYRKLSYGRINTWNPTVYQRVAQYYSALWAKGPLQCCSRLEARLSDSAKAKLRSRGERGTYPDGSIRGKLSLGPQARHPSWGVSFNTFISNLVELHQSESIQRSKPLYETNIEGIFQEARPSKGDVGKKRR